MLVSAYQVNNVLRVYGDQLRQSRISNRPHNAESRAPDRADFSVEGKRKAIIDTVSSDIVDRIIRHGPHETVDKEVFEKLENDYGAHLAVSREDASELIFKEIDENGETIKSLSIEDSDFLVSKLKNITKETIGGNLR